MSGWQEVMRLQRGTKGSVSNENFEFFSRSEKDSRNKHNQA
jgi:hypothetical protein